MRETQWATRLPELALLIPESDAEQRLLEGFDRLASGVGPHESRPIVEANGPVRAALVAAACLSPALLRALGHRSLVIVGAVVAGEVDLSFAHLRFPVVFDHCTFASTLKLFHATVSHLAFDGGVLHNVEGNGMIVAGDLVFSGRVRIKGHLSLERARISGDLRLNSTRIVNRGGQAMACSGCRVGGSVLLAESFYAVGSVSFYNARIQGSFQCAGARFANKEGIALMADLMKVDGAMFCNGIRVWGEVRMLGAESRGSLELDHSVIRNPQGDALTLENIRVRGSVFLGDGFLAFGSVRLIGADVGLDLDLSRGTIVGNPNDPNHFALAASRMRVAGNVYLIEFAATGLVLFAGGRVGGRIECTRSVVNAHNPTPRDARVGERCMSLQGSTIHGSVTMLDCAANALLDFRSIRVGRNLKVKRLLMLPRSVTGVLLETASIGGEFIWVQSTARDGTKMVLSHTRVGRLRHGSESWPIQHEQLLLNGCRYGTVDFEEALGGPTPCPTRPRRAKWFLVTRTEAERRAAAALPLRWLQLQNQRRFDPQPYEQLSMVLRESGDDDTARLVAIKMEDARRQYGELGTGARWRARAFGFFLRYGHGTARLWLFSVAMVVLEVR